MKNASAACRPYKTWTKEEEQALLHGVQTFGVGAWEVIRNDRTFACLRYIATVAGPDARAHAAASRAWSTCPTPCTCLPQR